MAKTGCPVCGGTGFITPKQNDNYQKMVEDICSIKGVLEEKEKEIENLRTSNGADMTNKELSDKVTHLLEEACSHRALIVEREKEINGLRDETSLRGDVIDKANELLSLNRQEIEEGTKTIIELKRITDGLTQSHDALCNECSDLRRIVEKQNEELLVYQLDQGLKTPTKVRSNHFLEFFGKKQ